MSPVVVTEADLLDALATASTAPEDARTVQQLAEETGREVRYIRRALQRLQGQGRLQVHRVRHRYIDGREGMVPAYTILPRA